MPSTDTRANAEPFGLHGRAQSLSLTLPPLSAVYFEHGGF